MLTFSSKYFWQNKTKTTQHISPRQEVIELQKQDREMLYLQARIKLLKTLKRDLIHHHKTHLIIQASVQNKKTKNKSYLPLKITV